MTNENFSLRSCLIGLVTLIAFGVGAYASTTFAQDGTDAQNAPAVATDDSQAPLPAATTEAANNDSAPENAAPAQNEAPATPNDAASDAQDAPATDAADDSAAPKATPVEVEEVVKSGTGQRLVVFGSFILVVLLGVLFSYACVKKFRMPENNIGYFLIFFCFVGGVVSTIVGLANNRVNLGVDLRGGSILVYTVSPAGDSERDTVTNDEMGLLKNAIMKRINPSGVREISIQELGANSEIKITIPEADDVEVARLERVITGAGNLQFRILASLSSSDADEQQVIRLATSPEFADEDHITLDKEKLTGEGIVVGATWLPVDPTQMSITKSSDCVQRPSHYVKREDESVESVPTVDVLVLELDKPYEVNGEHVKLVQEGVGNMGEPEVHFTMRAGAEGARNMERLTSQYCTRDGRAGRPLGVVFNKRLFNAPTIQSTISDRGQITFGNNLSVDDRTRIQGEVRDLIAVMNAGVLPATLSEKPVTKMVTGPSLGADTIRKGKNAILWGGVIVLLFMIAYYGFGGLIAAFAVVMNLALIMTAMIAMHAAFTLPGLAGLVLTVGMAVDANVLIFERIREELSGGATLRMAIRNGYQRAFTAIFDSNITTMLTAWILYIVGSEQIKSFAITLFLGVLFSMFTATYICRIIFQSCEKAGWISNKCVSPCVPGLKQFGRPNWDFFTIAKKTYWVSVAIIIVGLIGTMVRGKGIFDVDFVGGVEIQTVFTEPVDIEELRQLPGLEDLSVSELSLAKDRDGNEVAPNTCYTISASCPKDKSADEFRTEVEDILKEQFKDKLRRYSMEFTVGETQMVTPKGSETQVPETTVAIKVNPMLSEEVVEQYFSQAVPEGEEISFRVTNEAYEAGSNDVADNWNVVFSSDNLELVKQIADGAKAACDDQSAFEASNTVGSSVAGYARTQGALAILGSLICIIAYLWFRFKHAVFGLSAVVGLIHDVCFTLGLIALSQWLASGLGFLGITQFKIGLATVAAFLTLIGYSLNDTIVLFDRMREVRGKSEAITKDIINKATNQTFSRTMLTSITTGFSVLVLYCFGGAGIHTFAFAMLVGVIVGTYSSIFICAPFLYWLLQRSQSKTPSNRVR